MTEKRFTYLNASRNKYIGSFFCNGEPLTNEEVVDLLNELHEENQALKSDRARYEEECRLDVFKELMEENEQLKQSQTSMLRELLIHRRIANCSNCKHQNYDWFEDGDEFEICEKGNSNQQIEYHICKEWEKF